MNQCCCEVGFSSTPPPDFTIAVDYRIRNAPRLVARSCSRNGALEVERMENEEGRIIQEKRGSFASLGSFVCWLWVDWDDVDLGCLQ